MLLKMAWKPVRSALLVVIFTLFIWLVADQYVRDQRSFSITVKLNSSDPNRYAAIAEAPFEVTLHMTLEGRRRQLARFADVVASKNYFEAIIDSDDELSDTEPQLLAVKADVLYRIREIRDSGLTVVSVSRESVLARIDEYDTVQNVIVSPDYGDSKVVATTTPQRLSVRMPRFAAQRLRHDPYFRPKVEQAIRDSQKPDNSFEITIPVVFDIEDLDPLVPLQITPSNEVTIAGRVETLVETRRKGPIQITWSIPDEVQRKYIVVPKPGQSMRRDIDVTGPKGQVEQLPLSKIRGFVDVMASDLPGREITRSVQFVLPEGFSLASGVAQQEVVFTLEPLTEAVPTTP